MIFLRPTDGAKLVLKKWIEELRIQPWSKTKKSNDQPAFNWALMKTAAEVCWICLILIIIKYIFCLQRSKNKVQTVPNLSNIFLIFHDFLSLTFILQVDLYLLPQAAFPTGGLYFKNKTWVRETKGKHVIIHNNYIIGFEKKTKRFRDYGLWLVDDHALESPLGRL